MTAFDVNDSKHILKNDATQSNSKELLLESPTEQYDDVENQLLAPEMEIDYNKRKRYLVFAVFVILMIILGSFGLLFWPSKPDVKLVSFKFDEDSPTTPEPDGELYTNWIGKVSVDSKNYFSFGIRELEVKAFLPSRRDTPVGQGKVQDLMIKGQSVTEFDINFKVPVYKPSSGKPSLLEECMNSPKVDLIVDVTVDLNAAHWTGKKIRTTITKQVDCMLPQLFALVQKFTKMPNKE
jgi:hypothetical protein